MAPVRATSPRSTPAYHPAPARQPAPNPAASIFPGYTDLRSDFTDQLDRVIADNTRMILNALARPDTIPPVTATDLRDVSDAKEEALRLWDARLIAMYLIDKYWEPRSR